MPKIPTYTAKGRITAETGSVKSNIKLSPFRTTAGSISNVVRAAEDYYFRERAIAEKAEADKEYIKLSSELDTIQEGASKQFDPAQAQDIFNRQSKFLVDEKLSQIKNKRVRDMIQGKFNKDNIRRGMQVKKAARLELDKQIKYNNETNFQMNLSNQLG